jgi:hypothetical protein
VPKEPESSKAELRIGGSIGPPLPAPNPFDEEDEVPDSI